MKNKKKIKTRFARVEDLKSWQWDRLWEFMSRYTQTTREYFEEKVRESKEMVLFTDPAGKLVGIGSLDIMQGEFQGKKAVAFFTANGVVAEEYRRMNLLQKSGFRVFLRERLRHPFTPLFWFYDTYSYKSYLLLPRNFVEYWPRYEWETPEDVKQFVNELAIKRYGSDWVPDKGIAQRSGKKKLKDWVAPISAHDLKDPHIAYYHRTNPGHAEGDMLVCLCPFNSKNLWIMFVNVFRRAVHCWLHGKDTHHRPKALQH